MSLTISGLHSEMKRRGGKKGSKGQGMGKRESGRKGRGEEERREKRRDM